MASKKVKAVQVKGEEAEQLIEEYLVAQYRPFAINDIIQNLHNKVSKTGAQKALESLEAQERIITKTFGKVVIYACKEQELAVAEDIDMEKYTLQFLSELRSELNEVEKDKNAVMEAWHKCLKEPSNEELVRIIKNNEETTKTLEKELQALEAKWDPANEEAINQMVQTGDFLGKELRKRSRYLKRLISLIKDTIRPTNMTELLESIGCEYRS
ncbi:hypothetical protein HG535_0B05570 [Zygotorulaspora mrakii]|uniref:Homologous-pairing protein 2 winged helix domain-containing protein n=1 Tax=Zygotorulaspora mrakii TaxID=42260 RepID=A0A7H9AZE0_ZYGMR|nr:uncharacterized protein HG535_0B05570 [Zygotorulaspora mrakii]QLG71514.1 hypothetical protein HG535_0B05570 [Zygotorulaspora mrakii]